VAPEVLNGDSYDTKADVYSFGMILFELFALQVPFDDESGKKFIRTIMNEAGECLSLTDVEGLKREIINNAYRPAVPDCWPEMASLMQKAWDVDPAVRPMFFDCEVTIVNLLDQIAEDGNRYTQDVSNYGTDEMQNDYREWNPHDENTDDRREFLFAEVAPQVTCTVDLQKDCLQSIVVTATCFIETCEELWVGTESGLVLVFSLLDGRLVCSRQICSTRLILMQARGSCLWCASDDGMICLVNLYGFALEATWRAVSEQVSPAFFNHLEMWLGCPNMGTMMVYDITDILQYTTDFIDKDKIVAALDTIQPLQLMAVATDGKGIQIEVARGKKGIKLAPGQVPLPITHSTTLNDLVMIACGRSIVGLNSAKEKLFQCDLDELYGRATCLRSFSNDNDIWVGCDSGQLLFISDGKLARGPSLFCRIIDIVELGTNSKAVLSYDGSVSIFNSASRSVKKETRLKSERSVGHSLIASRSCFWCILLDGKLFRISLLLDSEARLPDYQTPSVAHLAGNPEYNDTWFKLRSMLDVMMAEALPRLPAHLPPVFEPCSDGSFKAHITELFQSYSTTTKLQVIIVLLKHLEDLSILQYRHLALARSHMWMSGASHHKIIKNIENSGWVETKPIREFVIAEVKKMIATLKSRSLV